VRNSCHIRVADSVAEIARTKRRSLSTTEAQAIRKAQIKQVKSSSASTLHEHTGKEAAHQRPSVVSAVADSDSGRGKDESHQIAVVASEGKSEISESSWWERTIGRKKQGVEHHV